MSERELQVSIPDGRIVTAVRSRPEDQSKGWLVVYAPGAGSNIHDPFGAYASEALGAVGYEVLRIQFPYMEERRRRPDPPKVLEATWRSVIEAVRPEGLRLLVGGRSMGGRIASQVVAQGTGVDALALFAYPLRPPSNPDRRRDGHLPQIGVPTLFCSGTRDSFGTPDELRLAAAKVPRSRLHLLEGADHGFAVRRSSGRTRQDVWREAVEALIEWLDSVKQGSEPADLTDRGG